MLTHPPTHAHAHPPTHPPNHQALEALNGVAVRPEDFHQASITYQCLFRRYAKLSGMTVSAWLLG